MSTPNTDRPVALVTGSTSGIGRAIANRLSMNGYRLVIHSRQSADEGHALADCLGQGAFYCGSDLSDPQAAAQLADHIQQTAGRLDVLVNNAGGTAVIAHSDLAAATTDVWQSLYQLNVIAPWQLVSACQPMLSDVGRRGGVPGAVVNISSHAGVRAEGASIPYAVSKAALNHMTRLLARTLAPDIRVNAVAPGLVDTPMTARWLDAQTRWRERAPMRRSASPDDIAQIVCSLVDSDYLTGEIVMADGGLNLGSS